MYTAQLHQWLVHVHVYGITVVLTIESIAWFVRINLIEILRRKRRRRNMALCKRPLKKRKITQQSVKVKKKQKLG